MKKLIITLLTVSSVAFAQPTNNQSAHDPIKSIIKNHLKQYGKQEHFSAIQVSIKTKKDKINSYVVGTRSLDGAEAISTTDLFDIGSITKSFTSALALLAESEGQIKLDAPLKNYLSNYPHWGALSLISLMNMSTGLPNYSDSPKLNYLFNKNIHQYWSPSDLISLVYSKEFNPPLKPGYFYSNTGYILMDMILSNKYKETYVKLLNDKIIKPLNLQNTFYAVPNYSTNVMQRLVRGYSYNVYDNPELLGHDVTDNNLSWAGAAGAIIANSEDVVRWIEHLFIKDKLLTAQQKEKMQGLISLANGKPISTVNKENSHGFGLGIVEAYDPKIGQYWLYEGQTLGYRALYIYVPCNEVIISAFFNSATNQENDHAHTLLVGLYNHLLEQDHSLICQQNKTGAVKSA